MFTWLNKQGVRSEDGGFVVQFTGRFKAEYREGAKRLVVPVEDAFVDGKPAIVITSAAFATWDDGWTRNTPEQQERMIGNFRAALEFQGLKLLVN
jgi:hypothetical protein